MRESVGTQGCSVVDCERPHQSLGYCKGHAQRLRRYGDPGSANFRATRRTDDLVADPALQCAVDDCQRHYWARGYCPTHYRRWTRTGDPETPRVREATRKPCSVDGCEELREAKTLCSIHYLRKYYADNPPAPGSGRPYSRRWILKQYGMTPEDYENLVAAQGDRCAICRGSHRGANGSENYSWCVDHSHSTGKVRGLLCSDCNMGLGRFGDNPETLSAAAAYLTLHREA